RAPYRRRPAGNQIGKLAARDVVRCHWPGLDQSFAEHAELDRGSSLSRCRPVGSDKPLRGPRYLYTVRSDRRTVARWAEACDLFECAKNSRRSFHTAALHAQIIRVQE